MVRARARSSTWSSMGSVSRPVKVFCWLGWKEPDDEQAADLDRRAVPELRPRRRHRDGRPGAAPRAAACQANAPSATTDAQAAAGRERARGRATARRCRAPAGVGSFAGGAQRTAATIRVPISRCPSPAWVARRQGRQTGPVQRGEQPVAAAVAGEDAPGAVAAVRGRREPDHEDLGPLVAPAGDRPAPVGLVAYGLAALGGDLLAPGAPAAGRPGTPTPRRRAAATSWPTPASRRTAAGVLRRPAYRSQRGRPATPVTGRRGA